ncbi:glutamine synthetase [Streptomyces sp. NPDC058457]|uniref:glutamine synthetase n=1 Tax=Streptomyces sp. NPDC058457 TaxID=3346507 RepID=UPI0036668837
MSPQTEPQVQEVMKALGAQGIDVLRVAYPDLMGSDRSRDILLHHLPHAAGHGLAFSRAIYHTAARGDHSDITGGLEAGMPDIVVRPDLDTVVPLPWEPNVAWCIGDVRDPATGLSVPESPRDLLRQVLASLDETGVSAQVGPELEYVLLERDTGSATGWRRYAFDATHEAHGMSATARYALAGVLAHAPALSALLNPTVSSYKRFGPDTTAPWLINWGLDNHNALVRIPPERGAATRLEVRLGDATANPYLAVAGLLAAIRLGIGAASEPPAPATGYAAGTTTAALLPTDLGQALDALEADDELTGALGKPFVDAFLTFRRDELARFRKYVTDWEFREYAQIN